MVSRGEIPASKYLIVAISVIVNCTGSQNVVIKFQLVTNKSNCNLSDMGN